MGEESTTVGVQRYLDALAGGPDGPLDDPARARILQGLFDRTAMRLQALCGKILHGKYSRLARPPFNLRVDELFSDLMERLLKAMQKVRPNNVAHFFALANQHIRWELLELVRRLDERKPPAELPEGLAAPAESSGSGPSFSLQRMLEEIDNLPDDEREVFTLVRMQGLSQAEVAEILNVATRTVKRRLDRAVLQLAERLGDLRLE
jgi:RNA polymerase sigma factor (sigma-70 family)